MSLYINYKDIKIGSGLIKGDQKQTMDGILGLKLLIE
jgi:hypothetical protein